jgi:hypothetical protein
VSAKFRKIPQTAKMTIASIILFQVTFLKKVELFFQLPQITLICGRQISAKLLKFRKFVDENPE